MRLLFNIENQSQSITRNSLTLQKKGGMKKGKKEKEKKGEEY